MSDLISESGVMHELQVTESTTIYSDITLDECIEKEIEIAKHYDSNAVTESAYSEAMYHYQIAEWLKQLKKLRG